MDMFGKITPEQRGHLVGKMEQAAAEVLTEIKFAVRQGGGNFDLLYGKGHAEQYIGIAGDLVSILADLAVQPHVIVA